VLFVGDITGAAVHAFALRAQDLTPQTGVPASLWVEGACHVRIARNIEDVCGNNAVGAFDRRLRTDGDLESQQDDSKLSSTIREVMVYAKEPA
jgi:hypothetical protein